MTKIQKKILPFKLIIGLCLIIIIGSVGLFTVKAAKIDVGDELIDIMNRVLVVLEEKEGMLGEKVQFDKQVFTQGVWMNGTSQAIYFGTADRTYGLRDNAGIMQYKNSAGTWSGFGSGTPGQDGWLADATNNYMFPATNAAGDFYPGMFGINASSSPADVNTEVYIGGGGGLTMTGILNVAGAVNLNGGAVTFNEDSANNLDFRMESATDVNMFMLDGSANKIGMGVADPDAKLEIFSTTKQLKLSYDGSNETSFTVNSGGKLTIAPSDSQLDITGTTTISIGLIVDTNTLFVDADSNKVGINVTDADYALEIVDTSAILKLSYDGSNACTFVVDSGGNLTQDCSGDAVSFAGDTITTTGNILGANITASGDLTAGGALYVINSGDNVGIASSSPFWRLSVVDTSPQLALAYDTAGYVTFSVDTDDDLTIYPTGGDVDITGTLTVSGTITSTGVLIASGDATVAGTLAVTGVTTLTDDLIVDTDTLFVDNSGDAVGMGTTTPTWALSITKASAQLGLAYNGDGYALFSVSDGDDLTITASGGEIDFSDENVSTTGTFAAGATTISGLTTIGAYDLLVDTDTLFVDSSENNVGIGTSTPQRSLVVDEGTTATSSIMIGDIYSGSGKGCLDIASSGGVASRAYLNAAGTSWVVEVGTCE